MRKLEITFFFLFLVCSTVFAQSRIVPYEFFYNQSLEKELSNPKETIFSSSKPFVFSSSEEKRLMDSSVTKNFYDTTDNDFERKLTRQSIINVSKEKFSLSINPLFYFSFAKERKQFKEDLSQNTRGLWVRGTIGKDFYFDSQFLENQVTAPMYVRDFNTATKVYPGMGRTKPFKTMGYDFAMSSGNLVYLPHKNVTIMAGTGKHFYGFGYRSLLLSDNSFNYPYIKTSYQKNWFRYEIMFASLMNIYQGEITFSSFSEPTFRKKNASVQYLVFMPTKRIEIGFFNSVIWRAQSKSHPYFDFNTLNPVPFYNVAQYGLADKNNALIGLIYRIKVNHKNSIYGQYMADNLKSATGLFSKNGVQFGWRSFDFYGIKNLNFLLEYNSVSPYSYTTQSNQQNYVHYNQSLAHPWGANFKEVVAIASYTYKGFFVNAKINVGQIGMDSAKARFGQNVLWSDISGRARDRNILLQGLKTQLEIIDIKFGYTVNPTYNFQVFIGFFNRRYINYRSSNNSQFFTLGVRTNIWNTYLDF